MGHPAAERILSILASHDEERVATVVPWVVLVALDQGDAAALPERTQEQVVELFSLLGLDVETLKDADKMNAVMASWPRPDAGIMKEINRALRELLQEPGASASSVMQEVIGAEQARGVLGGQARPSGTTPGGPLARLMQVSGSLSDED